MVPRITRGLPVPVMRGILDEVFVLNALVFSGKGLVKCRVIEAGVRKEMADEGYLLNMEVGMSRHKEISELSTLIVVRRHLDGGTKYAATDIVLILVRGCEASNSLRMAWRWQ